MVLKVQQEKRVNLTPVIIIGLILIGAVFVYFKYFKVDLLTKTETVNKVEMLPSSSQELLKKGVEFSSLSEKINQVLNHPVFKTLSPHIEWPLASPPLGKQNPFEPL